MTRTRDRNYGLIKGKQGTSVTNCQDNKQEENRDEYDGDRIRDNT